MKSEATEVSAAASSSTGAEDGSPGATARRLVSSVTSSLEEDGGVSEATSTVKDISIGDGAITIESVVTEARITSDGTKAKITGETRITGVMVADQFKATIDEKGLHINDQDVDLPDLFGEEPVKDGLDQLGISVKLARPIKTLKGGSASTELGGLVVRFDALALKPFLEPLPDEVKDEIYKNVDMRKAMVVRFGSVSLGVDATRGVRTAEASSDRTSGDLQPISLLPAEAVRRRSGYPTSAAGTCRRSMRRPRRTRRSPCRSRPNRSRSRAIPFRPRCSCSRSLPRWVQHS